MPHLRHIPFREEKDYEYEIAIAFGFSFLSGKPIYQY
jgi:hypothetical protein